MRFKTHKYGETRTKRIFLWYPRECNGWVRWLEFATVRQLWNLGWEIREWLDE